MILTETTIVKISTSNMKYWRGLGYDFPNPSPRWGIIPTIEVRVTELEKNSNVYVACKCDECSVEFENRFGRNTDTCYTCFLSKKMQGNTLGSAHKGKTLPQMCGSNNPNWNPKKTEFKAYANKVRWLTEKTYRANKKSINPNAFKRTLCGIEGGWQLDHIVSVKEGFEKNVPPEDISKVENLQMLPWFINRSKAA